MNSNRNHAPKEKTNQEIKLVTDTKHCILITKAVKQRTHQAMVYQKYQPIHPVVLFKKG